MKTERAANHSDSKASSPLRTAYLDPATMRQARIGHSLREAYDGITDRPLPNQLEMLLSELDTITLPSKSA